jgi:hypothetical protein
MEASNDVASTADGKTTAEASQQQEDKVSYSTYNKVLDKLKNTEREFTKLREEMTKAKDKEAEANGSMKQLVESLRERNQQLEGSVKETRSKFAAQIINSQIKEKLAVAGCVDPNKALKFLEAKDYEALEVSDDFSVNPTDIGGLVERMRKENEFMFKRTEKINDLHPTSPRPKALEKDINKMSYADKKAALLEQLNKEKL